jgi:pentatricopeptide repeat protein
MGFFSAKSTTTDPMSLYTPEQQAIIRQLMGLASTGSGGGINLGQAYGGDLGYYQQTPGELQALSGLQGLVNGGDITGARDVYSRMANNKFNPDDPSSGYAAYSRALAKAGGESQDALNREAARTGGVFGSGRGRDTASLQADMANQRGSYLAQLYNQGENRALQGASGLQSLVGTQQSLFQQLASQAEVERLLKDQQAKDKYTDFTRQQNENMTRIGLMKDQWQTPMAPITTKSPSTFSQVAAPLGTALGFMVGGPAGAAIGGSLGGMVGTATSGVTQTSSYGLPQYLSQRSNNGMSLQSLLSLFGGGNTSGGGLIGSQGGYGFLGAGL